MAVRLFSYGTLRQPEVQKANYGRLLTGSPAALVGYRLRSLVITDASVVRISGKAVHEIAVKGNAEDRIEGLLFELSEEELAASDAYEVDAYRRVEVLLESGAQAWCYIGKPD